MLTHVRQAMCLITLKDYLVSCTVRSNQKYKIAFNNKTVGIVGSLHFFETINAYIGPHRFSHILNYLEAIFKVPYYAKFSLTIYIFFLTKICFWSLLENP